MENINQIPEDEFQDMIKGLPEMARWEILKKRQEGRYRAFQEKYFHDPLGFVKDCMSVELNDYQKKMVEAVGQRRRVGIVGPHSLGKSMTSSSLLIWHHLTRDGFTDHKEMVVLPSWQQGLKYFWEEVKKQLDNVRWDVVGREKPVEGKEFLKSEWQGKTGVSFLVASSDAARVEGIHASSVLIIVDESKAVTRQIFEAIEGAVQASSPVGPPDDPDKFFNGLERAYIYAVSTPGGPHGPFYDMMTNKDGAYGQWYQIHVTVQQLLEAGRITQEFIEARKRQWGETSAVFRSKVLGMFTEESEDGLIPLSWVESANLRWLEIEEGGGDFGSGMALGVDVAGKGKDKTKIAYLTRKGISNIEEVDEQDTMVQASIVRTRGLSHNSAIVADEVAIGAGFVSKLQQLNAPVIPFNGQWKSELTDQTGTLGFTNMRSACYWHLRELLDPENGHNIALPPNDDLLFELTTITYSIVGEKIKLEPKLDFKKRIRRSPDTADAVIYAFAFLVLENEIMEKHASSNNTRTVRTKAPQTQMIGTARKNAISSGKNPNKLGFETYSSRRGRSGFGAQRRRW